MDRFALLRLTNVVLKEVLKCFTPIELYQMSHCSRKMAQLIPSAGTEKISLEIDFGMLKLTMNEEYTFRFSNKPTENHIRRNWEQDKDPRILQFDFPDDSDTEIVDRMKTTSFHLSALFKCPIKSLEFGRVKPSGQCRSIIEQVITSQDSLENLKLSGVLKNEDLKWILENVNVTGTLKIWMNERKQFSIDWKLNCRQLLFNPASWVTVDNLISLTSCATIELPESNLTYQDMNIFMEKWKSGLFSNLEYLRVSLKNDGKIIGFSKEQLSTERGSERDIIVDKEYFGTCDRGIDVTNNDGKNGSIQISPLFFELFVWKD